MTLLQEVKRIEMFTHSVRELAANLAKTERIAARQRKALHEEIDWLHLCSRELTQSVTAATAVEGQEARS